MKRLVRFAFVAAVLFSTAAIFYPSNAVAQPPPPNTRPAQIDRNGVIVLIRTTLLALDDANKSGNYTVLRDLSSPAFQANTDARLAEIFAAQRRDGLDLSGVAVIDPQLSVLPVIDANGIMHMAGIFPSAPVQVNFDLAYAPVNGQWKLFGISVGVTSSAPAAPPAPSARPPAAPAPAQTRPPAGKTP